MAEGGFLNKADFALQAWWIGYKIMFVYNRIRALLLDTAEEYEATAAAMGQDSEAAAS
jgi:hypothetical protein